MTVWILAACLVAALVLVLVLLVALRRARSKAADTDRLVEQARAAVRAVVQEEATLHADEMRRVLARERAASISGLVEEERRLGEERRVAFLERERRAGEELADALARTERRLEERLRGFSDDLERAQRHLETQLARLTQNQSHALAEVEARIEADAAALGSTADEQRRTVLRLREEVERAAGQAVSEALDELESSTAERRRAVEETTDRLRQREAAIAASLEEAEVDVRARLDVILVEWEKRQTERLERVLEREVERHVQIGLLQVEERLRDAREDALSRLQRELDRTVELLAHEELARRLDEA